MKVLQGKVKQTVIPDLVAPDSSIVSSAAEKANLLNSFFVQQTILDGADTTTPDESSPPLNDRSFSTISTTPSAVYDNSLYTEGTQGTWVRWHFTSLT